MYRTFLLVKRSVPRCVNSRFRPVRALYDAVWKPPKTVVLSSPPKFRCQERLPRIPKVYSSVWSHSSHSFMLPFPFSFPFWLPHHPLPALLLPFPLCVLPCFFPFLASQFPCQSTTLPCVPTVHSYSLLSLLTHSSLPCVTTVHIGNNIHCTVPFLVFPFSPIS